MKIQKKTAPANGPARCKFRMGGILPLILILGSVFLFFNACEGPDNPAPKPAKTYTVTKGEITPAGSASFSITPTSAKAGATITLSPMFSQTPSPGYELERWVITDDIPAASIAGGKYTFKMPAKNVQVGLRAKQKGAVVTYYSVSISQGITHGTVTTNKSTAVSGENVTLTLTPSANYKYLANSLVISRAGEANVTYTGGTADSETPVTVTFLMPSKNVEVTAEFVDKGAVSFNITKGTITPEGKGDFDINPAKAPEGTTIYLTLKNVADDYEFQEWNITPVSVVPAPTEIAGQYSFPMQGVELTVGVTFKQVTVISSGAITVTAPAVNTSPPATGTNTDYADSQSGFTAALTGVTGALEAGKYKIAVAYTFE